VSVTSYHSTQSELMKTVPKLKKKDGQHDRYASLDVPNVSEYKARAE